MKRYLLISLLFLLFLLPVRSQNLLLNPSFENIDTSLCDNTVMCDAGSGELAPPWQCLVATPDILTPCHYNGFYDNWGAPYNQYGFQMSFHEKNYCFIQNEMFWFNNREFFLQIFPDTLEAGREYCLSMWVSTPDSQQYCSDCLESYFSIGLPDTTGTGGYLINFAPQVKFFQGVVFCDTVGWQKVNSSFIASGGENTITIGCFTKDEDVLTQTLNSFWKFGTGFYIDAIALYPCDASVYEADAGNDTGICIGESLVLGTHDLPEYEYLWLNEYGDTLGTDAFLAVQPEISSTYTLQVTDFKFDRTTDEVHVEVENCDFPLYVPNIFSPNNDGINDLLCVRGQQIEALQFFALYDRWGQEVFICNGTGITPEECCWDGKYKSENMPVGVYFWYAEALMKSGNMVSGKGNVTLVR